MKLLIAGDMAYSGFGTVTRAVTVELLSLGVDVRIISQNQLPAELPEPFRSRTVDMATFEAFGGEVTDLSTFVPGLLTGDSLAVLADGSEYGGWKPDACLVVADYWGAQLVIGSYIDAFRSVPTYHYCPVEGIDLPPSWKRLWDVVSPIAMSKFGQTEIAKVIGHLPPMAYHGVDTAVYHPASMQTPIEVPADDGTVNRLGSRDACKALWQAVFGREPDTSRVMLLRTDAHVPRKHYASMLRALSPVMERNPNVDLVLHCRIMTEAGNLEDTMSKLPREVRSRIFLTAWLGEAEDVRKARVMLSDGAMASLYNAADVYVSGCAEGFGLTIAEAIACGTPSVGLDYSSVPEVLGPAGILVPYDYLYDNGYDHFWAHPDEAALGRAVEYLVTHKTRRRELGALGPAHVRKHFDWADAARIFADVMEPKAVAA